MGVTRLLVLGDSIAAGQCVPSHESWPSLLTQLLPQYFVIVEALNGATTRIALERIQSAQRCAAEVAIVQFGINDCNKWDSDRGLPRVSPRAFAANLEEIVERLRRSGVKRVFMATNHPVNKSGAEECEGYNRIIRASAHLCGASLIDHALVWSKRGLAGMLLDGVHPSPAGHELYAATVAASL